MATAQVKIHIKRACGHVEVKTVTYHARGTITVEDMEKKRCYTSNLLCGDCLSGDSS